LPLIVTAVPEPDGGSAEGGPAAVDLREGDPAPYPVEWAFLDR